MPTLSPGKRAGCEDFSRRKIVTAATSGWAAVGPFVLGAPSVPQKPLLGAVRGSHASFQASLALRARIWSVHLVLCGGF